MHKILLILKREYLSRVRKKSFIIMTIIGPVLIAALFILPIIASRVSDNVVKILVVDKTGIQLSNTNKISFSYKDISLRDAINKFKDGEYDAILYIPPQVNITNRQGITLYSEKQPSIDVVVYIENFIQREIETALLTDAGLDRKILDSVKKINVQTKLLSGETTSVGITTAVGYIGGFLIYIFIFLYGAQVLRGVIEEKTNRIVEVIISSVKPFQLMMGKIIGISLVGLTQFVLWIVLSSVMIFIASTLFVKDPTDPKFMEEMIETTKQRAPIENVGDQEDAASKIFKTIESINFPVIIGIFIFYFLGGYLLYAALFAAVGAAVDTEADTQQFMLPITIPLIGSVLIAQYVINSPDGPIAFWFSMIPFTSPVIMMVRIPFGVPIYQIIISMVFLILGFILMTWLAAKIYRTGILMYGKKITYKELGRWLFYK